MKTVTEKLSNLKEGDFYSKINIDINNNNKNKQSKICVEFLFC